MILEPKFLKEGYAVYPDDYVPMKQFKNPFTGELITPPKYGMDFIGVKPDAPQWAKNEYEQWVKGHEEAKKQNMKF